MADVNDLMKEFAEILEGEVEQQELLRGQIDGLASITAQQGQAGSELVKSLSALRTTRQSRRRWRTAVAIAASGLGLAVLLWSSRLHDGFGPVLLEALGAALITFVLIDLLVRWVFELPEGKVRDLEERSLEHERTLTETNGVVAEVRSRLQATAEQSAQDKRRLNAIAAIRQGGSPGANPSG